MASSLEYAKGMSISGRYFAEGALFSSSCNVEVPALSEGLFLFLRSLGLIILSEGFSGMELLVFFIISYILQILPFAE